MAITLDGTAGLTLPSWTTATRPASPADGQMGLNTTLGYIELYSASLSSWSRFQFALECAQLGSTVAYTIPSSTQAIVPFDTGLVVQNMTINATNATVNGIEAYHWRHSTAGVYRLRYDVRTTSDSWQMISVCRNNNAALPVGNGFRTGAPSGLMGITLECLYRVTNTSDRFGVWHWCVQAMSAMTAHSVGNPPSTFFVTPDVGTAPTTGYYNSITITKL